MSIVLEIEAAIDTRTRKEAAMRAFVVWSDDDAKNQMFAK